MKTETTSDLEDHGAQTELKTECGATITIGAWGNTEHRRKIAQIVRAALEKYEEPIKASFSYANDQMTHDYDETKSTLNLSNGSRYR